MGGYSELARKLDFQTGADQSIQDVPQTMSPFAVRGGQDGISVGIVAIRFLSDGLRLVEIGLGQLWFGGVS